MPFRDIFLYPATLMEKLEQDVKADRNRYLTRHLPVSTALTVVSVLIHLKAKSFNASSPAFESGIFLLISAVVMLFFVNNTGIAALNLWVTRPRTPKEN